MKEKEFDKMKYEFWLVVISFILITIILLGLMISISYINSPTVWTFKIEMDNNTLKAFESINYTAIESSQLENRELIHVIHVTPSEINNPIFVISCEDSELKMDNQNIWCEK